MSEEPVVPNASPKRRINLKTDKIIPILVVFLSMVYSMRGNVVLQHLKHLLFGFVGMFLVYQVDYRKLGVAAPLALIGAVALLVLTLFSQAVRGVTILGRDVQTFYFIGFLISYPYYNKK